MSKNITFGDLIIFKNVVYQYCPNLKFSELVKNALILRGTNIVNPTMIISYYENYLKEKDETIENLKVQIKNNI